MTEEQTYHDILSKHGWLQIRTRFHQANRIITHWQEKQLPDDVEYKFVTGAIYDYRNRFVKRLLTIPPEMKP